MDKTYCLKEITKTGNKDEIIKQTKNGRRISITTCTSCGSKKSRFV